MNDRYSKMTVPERVLCAVKDGITTPSQIAMRVGATKNSVHKALMVLRDDGRLDANNRLRSPCLLEAVWR